MTCFSGWSSSLYLFAADHFIQLAPHAHRAFIRTKQDRVQVPKIMIAYPALLQLDHRLVLCSAPLRACFRIHLVERDIFKREVVRRRVEIMVATCPLARHDVQVYERRSKDRRAGTGVCVRVDISGWRLITKYK